MNEHDTEKTDLDIPSIELDSHGDVSSGEAENLNGAPDQPDETEDPQEAGVHLSPSMGRPSTALQEMDRKHSWLDEAERRCSSTETSFISKAQYVALSNHFHEVLERLHEQREEMPGVYGDFANLFQKFRTCFVGGQRLQNKVFQLNAEKAMIHSEMRKLKIKLYDAEHKIEELSGRVEDLNQSAVDSDKEKVSLQHKIIELEGELSKRQDQQPPTEDEEIILDDEKEQTALRLKELEKELTDLRENLASSKKLQDIYQEKLAEADKAASALQNELTATKSELQKKVTSLEKALEKVAEYSTQLEEEMEKTQELESEVKRLKDEIKEAKAKYKRLLTDLKKSQKESDGKSHALDKLRKDLDIREDRITLLTTQKETMTAELTQKQIEINSLKVDNGTITRQKNEYFRRIGLMEKQISQLESRMENLKRENASQKKDLESLRKVVGEFDSKNKELTKERDGYLDEVQKQMLAISEQKRELKLVLERETILKKELDACNRTIENLQSTIKRQEKEQERIAAHARSLSKTIEELRDEIKRMELQVTESQKAAGRFEQQLGDERLKNMTLAEDVRFYRKSCADAKHVTEQTEGKLDILDKHVLQLRSYNKNLDEKRKELLTQNQSLEEQLGSAKESLKQERKNGENLAVKLRQKDNDEREHFKKIATLEQEIDILQKKLQSSLKEKDFLVTKIREKDDVIVDLKEQIKLLESDLEKMDHTLGERGDEVQLLKLQLRQVNRNKTLLEGQVENMHATRQELTNVQEELQEEKLKCKGIEEEIQRPINFHRWRILEGTDPDRAQLVTKSLELQKQLVKKTADLEAKEAELLQKEQEVQKLREQVQRRSESGVDNELWECKRELRARMDRLKCLTAENNMYETAVAKYRKEIMTLREELKKYKLDDFKFKIKF